MELIYGTYLVIELEHSLYMVEGNKDLVLGLSGLFLSLLNY